MIERFQGQDGQRRLVGALQLQRIVGRTAESAEALAAVAVLEEFSPGDILIHQGGHDQDLFFILAGRVAVKVQKRIVAHREAGSHVGEIAMIDPTAKRTATVEATESTVVAVISEADFVNVANAHPRLWRAIAVELGARLNQRGRFIAAPNEIPRVFIGSSKEALPLAEAIRDAVANSGHHAALWSEDVFGASRLAIEDLESQLSRSDFAVLVVAADDWVSSREQLSAAPRDNVILELGLFIGAIGRLRTFAVVPSRTPVKVPSDLLGMTLLRWDSESKSQKRAVAAASSEIILAIGSLGAR
jgi:CRP/FNR family cyclic AMP-dependent transcriptional regulator